MAAEADGELALGAMGEDLHHCCRGKLATPGTYNCG